MRKPTCWRNQIHTSVTLLVWQLPVQMTTNISDNNLWSGDSQVTEPDLSWSKFMKLDDIPWQPDGWHPNLRLFSTAYENIASGYMTRPKLKFHIKDNDSSLYVCIFFRLISLDRGWQLRWVICTFLKFAKMQLSFLIAMGTLGEQCSAFPKFSSLSITVWHLFIKIVRDNKKTLSLFVYVLGGHMSSSLAMYIQSVSWPHSLFSCHMLHPQMFWHK